MDIEVRTTLNTLTREMIIASIAEYNHLGKVDFIKKWAGRTAGSKNTYISHKGQLYDIKAIIRDAICTRIGRDTNDFQTTGVKKIVKKCGFEVKITDKKQLSTEIKNQHGGMTDIKIPQTEGYIREERLIDVSYKHKRIQEKLGNTLKDEYGENNVLYERDTLYGKKIDIWLKANNEEILYEVKIADDITECLRLAIGQLLEYGFWNGEKQADKLIIVGEHDLNPQGEKYLDYLRNTFKLPISYLKVEL